MYLRGKILLEYMDKGVDANYKRSTLAHNNIVKAVSIIQKALSTGKANTTEIKSVSRYVTYSISNEANTCIKYIDGMMARNSKSKRSRVKEYYGNILHNIKDRLNNMLVELTNSIPKSYESLILPNGHIDKVILGELIKIDNEIAYNLKILSDYLAYNKRSAVNDSCIEEISSILSEIELCIDQRKNICKIIK